MYYFLINAIFTRGQKERSMLFEKKELDIMLKIYNTAVANLKKIIKRDFISGLQLDIILFYLLSFMKQIIVMGK